MPLSEPIRAFWYAYEARNPDVLRTPWGAVVSDARFPKIYDANHANILEPGPSVTLADVREPLRRRVRELRLTYEHVEVADLDAPCPATDELVAMHRGPLQPDVVMVYEGPLAHAARGARGEGGAVGLDDGEVRVRPAGPDDPWFTEFQQACFLAYAEGQEGIPTLVVDEDVARQLAERGRIVEIPAGQRFFVGMVDEEPAGTTALVSLEGVGYLDNVVTLTRHRRHGVATATVTAAVRASLAHGDTTTFLLTDENGPARSLYERLGFRVVGRSTAFTLPAEG